MPKSVQTRVERVPTVGGMRRDPAGDRVPRRVTWAARWQLPGSPDREARRNARSRWTGPGPSGPLDDSATARDASERQAPRDSPSRHARAGGPTNCRTEQTGLVDRLGSTDPVQPRRAVGGTDQKRYARVVRLHDTRMELGRSSPAGGADHRRPAGTQRRAEGEKGGGPLVQADVDRIAGRTQVRTPAEWSAIPGRPPRRSPRLVPIRPRGSHRTSPARRAGSDGARYAHRRWYEPAEAVGTPFTMNLESSRP